MLISYRWLGRHIDLEGLSPQDVVDSYMTHTAEVEGLEPFAPHLSAVTVGHVVEREKHPDADKLNVCKVDLGDGEPRQIVCGAPNVDKGQNVAVATVDTVLPGDFKIKKSKIRGVESHGMICSERELELGDNHDGIWVLSPDAKVGEPVAKALDIRQEMRRKHDGGPGTLPAFDLVGDLTRQQRIDARRRFVEQEQLGIADQRRGQSHLAHGSLRQRSHRAHLRRRPAGSPSLQHSIATRRFVEDTPVSQHRARHPRRRSHWQSRGSRTRPCGAHPSRRQRPSSDK